MKTAFGIVRIVMSVIVTLYTAYICGHAGYSAYMKCLRMKIDENGGYYLAFDRVGREAWLYIAAAVILFALGAASVFFLFRTSRLSAVSAAVYAVCAALLGVSLDTQLSEVMFFHRDWFRTLTGVENPHLVDVILSIKPLLARLCIYAAVCYIALYLIDFYKQHRKEK